MKHYNKFYEIGSNRYYTITADDDIYIATESFLNVGKKRLFRKQDSIVMGFKLLKFSTPIAILFNEIDNLKKCKKQNYKGYDDMIEYVLLDNRKLKDKIEDTYNSVKKSEIKYLKDMIKTLENEKEIEFYKNEISKLEKLNLMQDISIDDIEHTSNNIIKTMIRENLQHLYTEKVSAFCNNVFLYDQDCFGTITIYRITTVKNVVKTIDTFIYDKKVINALLRTMYEEGR